MLIRMIFAVSERKLARGPHHDYLHIAHPGHCVSAACGKRRSLRGVVLRSLRLGWETMKFNYYQRFGVDSDQINEVQTCEAQILTRIHFGILEKSIYENMD